MGGSCDDLGISAQPGSGSAYRLRQATALVNAGDVEADARSCVALTDSRRGRSRLVPARAAEAAPATPLAPRTPRKHITQIDPSDPRGLRPSLESPAAAQTTRA